MHTIKQAIKKSSLQRLSKLTRVLILGPVLGSAAATATVRPALAIDASAPAESAAFEPLSANDVSWLFPIPTRAEDFGKLIAISDLTAPSAQDPSKREPIWPDAAFAQFIAIADGPAGQIAGSSARIKLPAEVRTIDAWRIAALRIDPGAPGLSEDIRGQFGQSPQIRFILQPVTRNRDGTPRVHDIVAHLIYSFDSGVDAPAQPGCLPRPRPDIDAFRKVAADFAALRTKLEQGRFGGVEIKTAGAPLGVHPGLANAAASAGLRAELKDVLERHLSGARLGPMAIMALPDGAPEPWMFLSMAPVPAGVDPRLPNGGYVPVHGPTLDGDRFTEGLAFVRGGLVVEPTPETNNLNPITCKSAAAPGGLPVADRSGVATAELFARPASAAPRVKEVVDVISDPARSHFFNTDCVSCHTDTRRSMALVKTKSIAGVDPAVLPKDDWNVRNFGWFPGSVVHPELKPQSTATRRTAAETASVVQFINDNGLAK